MRRARSYHGQPLTSRTCQIADHHVSPYRTAHIQLHDYDPPPDFPPPGPALAPSSPLRVRSYSRSQCTSILSSPGSNRIAALPASTTAASISRHRPRLEYSTCPCLLSSTDCSRVPHQRRVLFPLDRWTSSVPEARRTARPRRRSASPLPRPPALRASRTRCWSRSSRARAR